MNEVGMLLACSKTETLLCGRWGDNVCSSQQEREKTGDKIKHTKGNDKKCCSTFFFNSFHIPLS